MNYSIELGPIRPPSEAFSILLRLTRNCPWNRCAFCPTFKQHKFSIRSVEEIKHDIDTIHFILEKIYEKVDKTGVVKRQVISEIATENNIEIQYVEQVVHWIHCGMKSLFLQDADSLIMKTPDLVEILNYVREKIPSIQRITSYGRAHTISRKSLEELKALKEAGLSRLHIGMESGSDAVLEVIRKGVTSDRQIDAGQKAMAAGFEVSLYFMPGCGGKELFRENALDSARVINAVNPTFIRIRSTVPMPGTPLHDMMLEGTWTPLTEKEKVEEIKLLIENISGITSTLVSDHIMNLLEEVEGTFPQDKEKMLSVIEQFFSMDPGSQENYIVGRRLGRYRRVSDNHNSPEIESVKKQLVSAYGTLDAAMLEVLTSYI